VWRQYIWNGNKKRNIWNVDNAF